MALYQFCHYTTLATIKLQKYLGISFGLSKFDLEVEELGRRLLELLGCSTLLIGQLLVYLLFTEGERRN